MHEPRALGVSGWSGSGKTTLLKKVLPQLVDRGLRVATVKHAHHEFDVDTPGKDSYEHRAAGASQVLVCSSRRWVLMHENAGAPEPPLCELLRRLSPCDLVLVEGFKRERHAKLEVYRPALGKAPLYPSDPFVRVIATDAPLEGEHPPAVDLNNIDAVVEAILSWSEPLDAMLQRLESAPAA